jgi:hypothetical protein
MDDLDDVLVFELPSRENVEAFRERFGSRLPCGSYEDAHVWLFTIELLAPTEDLPVLLREARDLLAELGLPSIRFSLDGRLYALDA